MMSSLNRNPIVTVHSGVDFRPAVSHGSRAVDGKPTNYPNPNSNFLVYLVYISAKAVDDWYAHHVSSKVMGTPDATAATLFKSARDEGKSSPYWKGENLVDLTWTYPCYLYIVFDLDNAKFIDDPSVPEFDPIQFHASKPVYGSNPVQYRNYDANHSFYDGKVITIEGRSAFRCVNHFRDEYGRELKAPQVRFYGYEIRFVAKWGTSNPRPHDIDPDGQNQGPPGLTSLVTRMLDAENEDEGAAS
jgi:hypothetical protein